uniref:Uncharacterized protein n=1 Tax=Chlamydomonas euryale TaxID=1486919 RepID=A0A6U2FXR9_9CHLO|mmetsp:Transcript_31027/g.92274  ORF Transcript_31027/g.92274 Transcript_31027/m.92274 type:complete len:101 (+) Transcript_31027:2138-2440(+)
MRLHLWFCLRRLHSLHLCTRLLRKGTILARFWNWNVSGTFLELKPLQACGCTHKGCTAHSAGAAWVHGAPRTLQAAWCCLCPADNSRSAFLPCWEQPHLH